MLKFGYRGPFVAVDCAELGRTRGAEPGRLPMLKAPLPKAFWSNGGAGWPYMPPWGTAGMNWLLFMPGWVMPSFSGAVFPCIICGSIKPGCCIMPGWYEEATSMASLGLALLRPFQKIWSLHDVDLIAEVVLYVCR